MRKLEPLDIELIEQPVRKDDIAGMGYVQAHTAIPVVADESCQSLADVEALARSRRAGHQPEAPEGGRAGSRRGDGAARRGNWA